MTLQTSDERLRIVVVDDAVDHADALAMVLRLEGLDAQTAHNGDDAIALIEPFKPHCMLFDICMPGMDGLELAKRLRAALGDDVVLLAMTGLDPKELRVADTFKLVDHYFKKPVDTDALLKVLKPD